MNKKYNSNIEKQSWKYIYLFLLLAAYVPASLQAQSGWTKPKKHTFKLDYSTYTSSDFRNNEGTSLKLVNYTECNFFIRRIWNYRPLNSYWLHTFFKQNSYETTNKVSGYGDVKLEQICYLDKAFPLSISIARFNRNQR
jgi:hypothetical protein